ncbi:MAG: glycosyltransferase family A protein [Bacteroidota bacterium]|jgi:glycosyltransferase involved in cell wall biosynthesis
MSKSAEETNTRRDYVVITPARNEEQYIRFTINSVLNQAVKPKLWIIVDDGSDDRTADVVAEASARVPWIRVFRNQRTGVRAPGRNVVDAFNRGLAEVDCPFDFLVKLDADLDFESDYFEKLLRKFEEDPKLGIAGGYCATTSGSTVKLDSSPEYHVRGATKMYRRECFEQIGGLVPAMGWDGLDELKAMMLGWRTRSFRDLILVHLRPTGKETGLMRYAWKWGKSYYFMGYDPLFVFGSGVLKFARKPYVLFGCTIITGYVFSFFTGAKVIDDKDLVKFIRRFQRSRIFRSFHFNS